MFATFTDWTSDEPKAFAESAHELWPSMKEAGAVNMRVVQTSDKGVRTMTMWPDAETALMAIQTNHYLRTFIVLLHIIWHLTSEVIHATFLP